MYTVTFYSYKGGVGRSQALINVAFELANRGRKVLIVDFDLEAPGLHTYKPFSNTPPQKGIVEFVNEFIDTSESPCVNDYLIESDVSLGASIWLMPAGRRDQDYACRLSKIDWNDLYQNHSGYLLFEDLKQQWRESINPEYVLIDSRTGHTDVGGICTRQLPDAVVAMMLPNRQNIDGMEQVVKEIRSNKISTQSEKILHFVLSNVPNLDDESDVLANLAKEAGAKLGFKKETARIHNYASLDLLDQAIHTIDRPKTRLATEYKNLTTHIQSENHEDRDGALSWLSEIRYGKNIQWTAKEEARLSKILDANSSDGEILSSAAQTKMVIGDTEGARDLFDAALAKGQRDPETLNRYAQSLMMMDDKEKAIDFLFEILKNNDTTAIQTFRTIRGLAKLAKQGLDETKQKLLHLSEFQAIKNLSNPDKIRVASILLTASLYDISSNLLNDMRGLVDDPNIDFDPMDLALVMIGCRRPKDAAEIITLDIDWENKIQAVFNFAMASWAETLAPNIDLFNRVIELDASDPESHKKQRIPNYQQCLGIAFAVTGDKENALEKLKSATKLARDIRVDHFSAWRYCEVPFVEFAKDNREIRDLTKGKITYPRFIESKHE